MLAIPTFTLNDTYMSSYSLSPQFIGGMKYVWSYARKIHCSIPNDDLCALFDTCSIGSIFMKSSTMVIEKIKEYQNKINEKLGDDTIDENKTVEPSQDFIDGMDYAWAYARKIHCDIPIGDLYQIFNTHSIGFIFTLSVCEVIDKIKRYEKKKLKKTSFNRENSVSSNMSQEFLAGMEYAWKNIHKLNCEIPVGELYDIFNTCSLDKLYEQPARDVIDKINQYEQRKSEDSRLFDNDWK